VLAYGPMPLRGPVLALDYGSRRIGMAISDEEARFAFPAGSLNCRGRERDLVALGELISERSIQRIVVGLPLHMDGRRGEMAAAAEKFANAIAEMTGLPVEMLDERWTTREAERTLRESRRGHEKRRGSVDAAAATLLLSTFLERARHASGGEPA
jgi:putative Holliday junction resolvase